MRTLTNRLLQEFPHIYGRSISHTSRSPRQGEEHGIHYWFSSRKEMEAINQKGEFLQVIKLFGNLYATAKNSINKITEQGKVCLIALEYEVLHELI
jgi:guanylate kinase